ncbi:MAG: AbrB/MazE/SpoVT family DNA-binding domain-containing protein [Chloroflexi bacterium]|nr:AbrB/MazE/SpoVT family DNA-binding domain-containing protein [Chloroflexota bacterium]
MPPDLEEYTGTVTQKGQVTIPIAVRRLLGVKPHDQVVFRVAEGKIELTPPTHTLEDAFGAVTPKHRPENFKALRDAAFSERFKKVGPRRGHNSKQFVDTNIFLRYLTIDNPVKARACFSLFQNAKKLYSQLRNLWLRSTIGVIA